MLNREADYAFYLYTCNRCRGCTHDGTSEMRAVCPANAMFGFFSYSGGGKGYTAQGILEGKVKPSWETAHVAFNCLTCGACAKMCPPGFETISFIRDLRAHLVECNIYYNDKQHALIENTKKIGSPWGKRSSELKGKLKPVEDGDEVALFLGCREKVKGETLEEVTAVLDAGGVSYGFILDEQCCGAPLLELGDRAGFEALAEENIERLNALPVERILALCPHCASALSVDYMNLCEGELKKEIVTFPTVVNELLSEGKLEFSPLGEDVTVVYHDPCRLGRFVEEYDSPREILASIEGIELVEMPRSRESALCCGAGGWMKDIVPQLSAFTVKERVREAKETGAELLVTACAYCQEMLSRGSGEKLKVKHLAGLLSSLLRK